MRRVVTLASSAILGAWLLATPAAAQPREPLRGVVADVRLVTATLPTGVGWTAPAPTAGALVPSRGLGGEAGVHLLFGRGQFRRLSVGASALLAEGRASGIDATGLDTPTIATRLTAVTPHLAMNFGHRQGWSYLSLGAGLAAVRSTVKDAVADPTDWGTVIHYGGGARWFLSEHVAVSLDLRFWALTPRPRTVTRVAGAATTRMAFGAGLSFQ